MNSSNKGENKIIDKENKAVVFSLNTKKDSIASSIKTEEEYCINLMQIREIITYTEPTRLPGKETAILGILNIRGELVPLLDLAHRLNHELDYEKSKIIITYKGNEKIGLLVQSVRDVVDYYDSEIESVPSTEIDFISGIIKKEVQTENEDGTIDKKTRVLTILNTDEIIKDEDTKFELIED